MKSLIFLFIGLLSVNAFALQNEDLKILPMEYILISDSLDESIEEGHFILSGSVKMFSSASPLEEVLIGCTSSGTWVRSDSSGNFTVELKVSDTAVYFYKDGWSEIVIEDYDFKNQHRIVMDVYMYQNSNNSQLKRKPVIYMYADEDLEVKVDLDPIGEFVFTYPEYKEGWNVVVNQSGGINVDGRTYPYLFWEAKSPKLEYSITENKLNGFVLASKEVATFFEEKLSLVGFNQTEITDFITYWGAILSQKDYAFVQFIIDENYQNDIAKIKISPEPSSMKRVFILCSPIDSPDLGVEVSPQELKKFERNGFTVVEWGGSIVDLEELSP
jgi:hypothetical protein